MGIAVSSPHSVGARHIVQYIRTCCRYPRGSLRQRRVTPQPGPMQDAQLFEVFLPEQRLFQQTLVRQGFRIDAEQEVPLVQSTDLANLQRYGVGHPVTFVE